MSTQTPSRLGGFSLAAALVALGLAGYALVEARDAAQHSEARYAALERTLDALAAAPSRGVASEAPAPLLRGAAEEAVVGTAGDEARPPRTGGPAATGAGIPAPEEGAHAAGAAPEALRDLVEEAVARKAAEMEAMRDKKPPIGVFASSLGLSEEQRRLTERLIASSQHEIRAILETRAADGTNFLDELVEVLAEGVARPGEKSSRGMRLFGRLLTENVPGTDETYAARAESVKSRLRDSLRREWSPEQYALFEAWQMDPTEVKDVEGSAWSDLEPRVIERAQQLGAK